MARRSTSTMALLATLFIAGATSAQTTWYVDDDGNPPSGCTTWADACPELQTALDLANPGDQVWVATGTYKADYDVNTGKHTGASTATFQLISGVALYGGFAGGETSLDQRDIEANETILSGDLTGNDTPVACTQDVPDCDANGFLCDDGFCIGLANNDENSVHVVTGSGTDSTAVLDGFTITGGFAECDWGGGMYNVSGNPTVINCTFTGNYAEPDFDVEGGGGMYNKESSPTVTNCVFTRNWVYLGGGGGMSNDSNSSPTVTHCTFSKNAVAYGGGGMSNLFNCMPTVINCTFDRNYSMADGGAMDNEGSSSPTVINCTFTENTADDDGGAVYNRSSSSPTFTNCAFTDNSSGWRGGGISHESTSSTTVTHCTFSENTAVASGGGISGGGGSFAVANSVLWGNTVGGVSDELAQISGTNLTVDYSLIQGLSDLGGIGNIDGNPLFADAPGGDFRILAGSPAIDSANNNAVPSDIYDLDDDGDTDEPIPIDLDGGARFIDDPATSDCPQPKADCGVAPIADMGAYELGEDCNGNGLPDTCDLDCDAKGGQCDPKTCGQSDDCNGNGIPDECEVPPIGPPEGDCNGNGTPDDCDIDDCPPGTPSCDDCNLNGSPDECDIDGGSSQDENMDGVPDECFDFTGNCGVENPEWSCPANWDLVDDFPNNDEDGTFNVTLDGPNDDVVLDVTVSISTLRLLNGATLHTAQGPPPLLPSGDLTLEEPGGLLLEGELLVGGKNIIVQGQVTIGRGGVYKADPDAEEPVSASLNAENVEIQEGPAGETGGMFLTDSMAVVVEGEMRLSGLNATAGGSCTPPDFSVVGDSSMNLGGDFRIDGSGNVQYSSSNPMVLGGDFNNGSVEPTIFDWGEGALLINGPSHTIEAAGEDLGPAVDGLADNFAFGTLSLSGGTTATVIDVFDNQQDGFTECDEALYVSTLVVGKAATLITNGCKVYYGSLADRGGSIPGLGVDVLEIVSCAGDFDVDGDVDAADLAELLASWGPCPGCAADFDGDGDVDAADLAELLSAWGACK